MRQEWGEGSKGISGGSSGRKAGLCNEAPVFTPRTSWMDFSWEAHVAGDKDLSNNVCELTLGAR